ncbi:hypothetical protein AGMMS49587_04480 [Spirochaetia bacterium]|nr:hypothetical protein AGMMS49587_04480 [Spirochaetia bacterium]
MRHARALLLFFCAILFSSCIGVKADITLKADGSGRISLEYRVSRQLDGLGQLDGNLNQPTIPTGKADFERSIGRLPGLRLHSFSSKQDEKDVINRAEIDFAGLEALIPFLDAAGEGASLVRAGEKTSLRLILNQGFGDIAPELLSLVETLSRGYEVAISLSGPKETGLALFDHAGRPIQNLNGAEWVKSGKKASLALPLPQLLSLKEGLELEFTW